MASEPLDPLYAAVFENPEHGTPDDITQAGCLALARLGKEAWNAWRGKYPTQVDFLFSVRNAANFSNCDFSGEHLSFDGFKFGDGAKFIDTDFGQANFVNAEFGDFTVFLNASLGIHPSFYGARFGRGTTFALATCYSAIFSCAQFADDILFDGAHFGDDTAFNGAKFGNNTSFKDAEFGENTRFNGAEFGLSISFISQVGWAGGFAHRLH